MREDWERMAFGFVKMILIFFRMQNSKAGKYGGP